MPATLSLMRGNRPWCWIVALLLPSGVAAALDCAEAAVEAEQITALRDVDPGQGVEQGRRLLSELLAQRQPCPDGEARLLAAIGSNLHILGRNHEAAQLFQQGLQGLDAATVDDRLLAVLHRGAGVALADAEAFDEALQHYLDALAASERAGDRLEFAKTAGNIGNLHNTLNDPGAAQVYHQRALAAFREADWKPGIAGSLVNLGAVSSKLASQALQADDTAAAQAHYQALLSYNEQALELFTELDNPRGIAYAASNIGLAHDRLGDSERAHAYHQRSLSLREGIGDVHGMINSLLYLSESLLKLGRLDEAEQAVNRAQSLLPEGNRGLRLEIVLQRSKIDEARGDFVAALAGQREHNDLYQDIMEADRRAQVVELRERFDAEQQAREIELLRRTEEVSRLQLQRQRLLLQGGFVVSILAIIVFVVLLSRMRLARRTTVDLRRASRTDPLTGLPNRRDLIERIEIEIRRAERDGIPFCLVMADIDHFKSINDRFGHDVGDVVLIDVARRIERAVREADRVARWGGEEFLLLLPGTDRDAGKAIADRLLTEVANTPFEVADQAIRLTLSIGVAEYRRGSSLDACLKAADQALLSGKRDGRNCVRVAA